MNMLRNFKVGAALVAFCGLMWAFCPWLARQVKASDCACVTCVDACEHVGTDGCDCHDNGCGCPMCVPAE